LGKLLIHHWNEEVKFWNFRIAACFDFTKCQQHKFFRWISFWVYLLFWIWNFFWFFLSPRLFFILNFLRAPAALSSSMKCPSLILEFSPLSRHLLSDLFFHQTKYILVPLQWAYRNSVGDCAYCLLMKAGHYDQEDPLKL